MRATKHGAVKIPVDIMKELETLPGKGRTTACKFTELQKAILLEQWPNVEQKPFARWWNRKYGWGSVPTLKRHYDKFKEEGE